MSPDRFELYRKLGRKALNLSFQLAKEPPKARKVHIEPEFDLTAKIEADLAH
jgi:hypothetical protein